jgi:hypothetical protein
MVKKLVTPIFRVSFPNVFEPHSMEEGKPGKFSVSAVWDPSKFTDAEKVLWQAINDLCDEVALEKFKKKVKDFPANFKRPIRDGAEKEDLEGYGPGKLFANISSKMRPGLIDRDRTPILPGSDAFYPGCYARGTVTAYAYDMGGGKGVALGLQNLQKVRDGDRLDSRTDAADDFGDDLGEDDRDPLD